MVMSEYDAGKYLSASKSVLKLINYCNRILIFYFNYLEFTLIVSGKSTVVSLNFKVFESVYGMLIILMTSVEFENLLNLVSFLTYHLTSFAFQCKFNLVIVSFHSHCA